MNFWNQKNFLDAVGEVASSSGNAGFSFCPFAKDFLKLDGLKLDIVTLASINFPAKKISEFDLDQWLTKYLPLFERKINTDVCVGAYKNSATDVVSIDINVKVHRSQRALTMEFAMRNDQYAIWDCFRGVEIIIGGSGKTVLTEIADIKAAAEALTNYSEYVFTAPAQRTLKWRKIVEQDLPFQLVDESGKVLGECDHCFSGSSFGDNWWRCGELEGRFPTIRQCRNHIEELVAKQS